jgi:hypothetical protein
MRQHHAAGDKVFVDYSGKKIAIVDPTTGEVCEAEIFVAVLGASADCRTQSAVLHLSYSYAAPCGPALLVTQDPKPPFAHLPNASTVFSAESPTAITANQRGYRAWRSRTKGYEGLSEAHRPMFAPMVPRLKRPTKLAHLSPSWLSRHRARSPRELALAAGSRGSRKNDSSAGISPRIELFLVGNRL